LALAAGRRFFRQT